MVQRQHRYRRREPNALGPRRDLRQQQIGAGQDPERREMMLADPRRMEPDLLGIERLVEDVGDERIGAPPVVDVMIVAQREIAELHPCPPTGETCCFCSKSAANGIPAAPRR